MSATTRPVGGRRRPEFGFRDVRPGDVVVITGSQVPGGQPAAWLTVRSVRPGGEGFGVVEGCWSSGPRRVASGPLCVRLSSLPVVMRR